MLSILVGALVSPWLSLVYWHLIAKHHGIQWPVRGRPGQSIIPLQAGVPGFFRVWLAYLLNFSGMCLTIYLMRSFHGSEWLILRPSMYFYILAPISGSIGAGATISIMVTSHLTKERDG